MLFGCERTSGLGRALYAASQEKAKLRLANWPAAHAHNPQSGTLCNLFSISRDVRSNWYEVRKSLRGIVGYSSGAPSLEE